MNVPTSDIIVADAQGKFYSILQSYFTDLVSVLEMVEDLRDPYDVYRRKTKKGAHCAGILCFHLSQLHLSFQ
jgi:hypothetical protein